MTLVHEGFDVNWATDLTTGATAFNTTAAAPTGTIVQIPLSTGQPLVN
jgi:hypothetical protein